MAVINHIAVPQSSCLYPRYKKIWDPYLMDWKVISYPCGKCWNCIHSFRESWRIRIYETMVWSAVSPQRGFIYDTLTVANEFLPSFSAFDYFTGESVIPPSEVNNDCLQSIIDHYGCRVPFLSKETVSAWIKRGRDNYNSFYRKQIKNGTKQRCPLRYFAALEYGPKWGRPHVHLCAFGVSRFEWVKFWAKPWRREMGFTKTKFIDLSSGGRVRTTEHCSRISTYISKYLLKGSLDNPLVTSGIVPSPWRLCSHGIGEDMLIYDSSRFRWLLNDSLFHMGNRVSVDGNSNSELYQDIVKYCQKFKHLSSAEVDSLKLYVQNGYKFALPRYYRDKLLATHYKGLAGYSVKTALFQDALDNRFEEILQYASDCRLFPGKSQDGLRYYLEHDLRAFNFACYRFAAYKRDAARRKASWNRLSSLNSYRRILNKINTGDVSLLL